MKISPSVAIILGLFPLLAQADISVTNNTSSYITAKVSIFCSDIAGDKGTIKPHSPFTVPQSIIDDYCKSGCEVKAYASKTCSGDAIATATIDQKNGVSKINNHNVDGYVVSGSGHFASIDGGPAKKWYEWLF